MAKPLSPVLSAVVRILLLGVATGLFLFLVEIALNSSSGQHLDQRAMNAVRSSVADPSFMVLSALGRGAISVGAVLAGVLMFIRLARRDIRVVFASVLAFGGANVTTQVLKHQVLDRPNYGLGVLNSLPSGHTTIAAGLGVVILFCLPTNWRATGVLIVTTLVSLMGISTVIAGWHRPSDVIAALLVTLGWAAATSLFLGPISRRPRLFVGPGIFASFTALIVLAIAELSIPSIKGATVLLGLSACIAGFSSLVVQTAPNSSVRVARATTFNGTGSGRP